LRFDSLNVKKERKSLAEYDELYRDYNQHLNEYELLLEKLGHPDAKDFGTLAEFFMSLEHYANSSARFYCWIDFDNNAQYWKPELHVRKDLPYILVSNKDEYMKENLEYLKRTPMDKLGPYCIFGSWIIRTTKTTLYRELMKLHKKGLIEVSYNRIKKGSKESKLPIQPSWEIKDHWGVTIFLRNVEQFNIVKQFLNKHGFNKIEEEKQ